MAGRRGGGDRRADFYPGSRTRPGGRTPAALQPGYDAMSTSPAMSATPAVHALSRSLVTRGIFKRAVIDSFAKLVPQRQWRNPVMFVVYIGSILTTILWLQALGMFG